MLRDATHARPNAYLINTIKSVVKCNKIFKLVRLSACDC